uniref:FMR1-interacting protein 1 conserved domain-containing protein n=1 Tax=Timema poppense TaxID=170557 RepID=A0A7R9DM89_TIMPO|nr:unnamed protein product [Timema poppensis]
MKTAAVLAQHIQEHCVCGIDGCKFTAHPKVIAKHVQMQHLTGLYHKICKADTPEDISKWIEERKRRYPSKENVERHKAEQQEKQQRGEHLDRPNKRFNEYARDKGLRGNRRGGRGRAQHRRHRGRPRDVDDSSLAVFREEVEVVDTQVDADQFSDTEWEACGEKIVKTPAKSATTVPVVSNILSALMSCYASDHTDSEDVIDVPKVNNEVLITQNESNSSALSKNCLIETNNKRETVRDETPDVSKIVLDETRDSGHNVGHHHDAPNGINLLTNKETSSLPAEPETPRRSGSEPDEAPITFEKPDHTQNHEETNNCDSNSRTLNNETQLGGRKNPRKRQRHNRGRTDENTESRQEVRQTDRGQKRDFHQNKLGNTSIYVRRRRPTLLEKLLGNEIRHERNAILQCVRYVVQNNFLELRSSISQATKDETADVQKVSKTNILAQCIHHIVHNKLIEEIVPMKVENDHIYSPK